jgi:hypothetical protein
MRVKFKCISAYSLIPYLPCYYLLHIIYFLHLLSTNHKCTQPCYVPLLLKPASQMAKMNWNTSTRSSRLTLPQLMFMWCYGVFRCSISQESCLSL